MGKTVHRYIPFLFLFIAIIIAQLIIDPIGEFALNDDFAYARSVYVWDQNGNFAIGGWPAMSLFSHALPGLCFVKLFGFSYTVLRFANMALCLLTLFYLYKFFLKFHSSSVSVLACSFIVFNPYYLNLFNSYMTDLTFFNYSFLSFYFLHGYFDSKKIYNLVLFLCFAILAILARQLGVILLLAFATVALVDLYRYRTIVPFLYSVICLFIGLMSLYFFEKNLDLHPGYNYQGLFFSAARLQLDNNSWLRIFEKTIQLLKFGGSLMLPSLVLFFPVLKNQIWFSNKLLFGIGIAFFSIALLVVDHKEITGHLVINFGLGVESTIDRLYIGTNLGSGSNTVLYSCLMASFAAGYFLLATYLSSAGIKQLISISTSRIFILILIVAYLVLIGIAETAFDRYCIFFAIFMLVYLMMGRFTFSKNTFLLSAGICFIIAVFSVLATKDYLNAARFKKEIRDEMASVFRIPDADINSGAEHELWDRSPNDFDWVNWDHFNDKKYLLTRGPLLGFHNFRIYPYRRYMPLGNDTFFVLQKNNVP